MTKTIIALHIAILTLTCASAFADPEVIKKDDLPANLKGGKVAKHNDGIPSCTVGRAKGDWGLVPMPDFERMQAARHPCIESDSIYVCRAGKNLSVRCE